MIVLCTRCDFHSAERATGSRPPGCIERQPDGIPPSNHSLPVLIRRFLLPIQTPTKVDNRSVQLSLFISKHRDVTTTVCLCLYPSLDSLIALVTSDRIIF